MDNSSVFLYPPWTNQAYYGLCCALDIPLVGNYLVIGFPAKKFFSYEFLVFLHLSTLLFSWLHIIFARMQVESLWQSCFYNLGHAIRGNDSSSVYFSVFFPLYSSAGWTVYHQTSERVTYKSSSKPRTRFLSGPVSLSICLYLFFCIYYTSSILHLLHLLFNWFHSFSHFFFWHYFTLCMWYPTFFQTRSPKIWSCQKPQGLWLR